MTALRCKLHSLIKNKEENSRAREDLSYTQKDGFNSHLGFNVLSTVKGD